MDRRTSHGDVKVVVSSFRDHFHARLSEWEHGMIMFGLGFLYLSRPEALSMPAWTMLPAWVTPWLSGGLVAGGAIRLLVLAINGSARPTPHIRAWMAGTSALIWMQLFFWIYDSGRPTALLVFFATLFVFDVANAMRAAGDAAGVDKAVKAAREEVKSGDGTNLVQ